MKGFGMELFVSKDNRRLGHFCAGCVVALAAVGLLSQTCLSQSPFVVQAEGPLSVEWRGLELVTQDEIATTGFAGLDKYTGYRADTIDGNIVHNIWVQAESPKGIPARREVVV